MPQQWPVIEYDPNSGRIRDIVTPEWAADIPVGTRVMAVAVDHAERYVTDWGNAILAEVVQHAPTVDGEAVIILAEPVE